MSILPPVEHEIRRAIRDDRAKTVHELQEEMERQFNRTFARDNLSRLSEKIARRLSLSSTGRSLRKAPLRSSSLAAYRAQPSRASGDAFSSEE
jgi:hypothetical protein